MPQYNSIQLAGLAVAMDALTPTTYEGRFSGIMDEARIWNVARTQSEIISTINSELASGTGLIGRWGMNEGPGSTTIADSTAPATNGTLVNGPTWVAGAPFNVALPAQHSLTVNIVGNGSVTPTSGTYYEGNVQLTAMPDSGWSFSGWSGDLTGSANPATINLNADKTITATFTEGGTVTFQEGVNGYSGTKDTFIRQLAQTTDYSAATTVDWDGEDGSAGQASIKLGLLRFDNIFGSQAGQFLLARTFSLQPFSMLSPTLAIPEMSMRF